MTTAIGDLLLVHIDNAPAFFARFEDALADAKPGWWHVKLLVLTLPLQVYTWILDESQIDGAPFTMGGTPVRLEKVVPPPVREDAPVEAREEKPHGKVVPLFPKKPGSGKD